MSIIQNKGLKPLVLVINKHITQESKILAEHWHITWVTHNSRVSQRMIEYKVKTKNGIWFDEKAEIEITNIVFKIIQKYDYNVYAYNICKDHIHMLIECDRDELSNIVKTIKSISATQYKNNLGIPNNHPYHLWAQKYNKWLIENPKQLRNTLSYIIHNRKKHNLSENKGLKPLVLSMMYQYNEQYAEIYENEMQRSYNSIEYNFEYNLTK